jgi:hypothetical protein
MSYIGAQPTTAAFPYDQFSGNGSTTAFTMSYAPASTTSIVVSISGVVQNPNTYSVSGLTLTFSPAPPTGTNNIGVLFLGLPVQVGVPNNGTVGIAQLSATGTPSSTTFHRGDNTWAGVDSLTTASGSAPSYSARAWVNFNGTGTVAIRASGNVTSITDGGTGIYTVNFTTAMPDGNYAFSGIVTNFTGGFLSAVGMPAGGSLSTTSCLVNVEYSASGGTFYDPTYCLIAVFR